MKKIVVIGGPTSSGKTNLAIQIAKKLNGELINADSRIIYKYLNIGTNKGEIKKTLFNDIFEDLNPEETAILPKDSKGQTSIPVYSADNVKIHLIDFLEPDRRFNLYTYKKLAETVIDNILKKGKLPILVGGTGLYIDSILNNYQLSIDNSQLERSELEKLTVEELQNQLRSMGSYNLSQLNQSDRNNPRRLVRAIEKANELQSSNFMLQSPKYQVLFLYPNYNWEELKKKIENRVEEMFQTTDNRGQKSVETIITETEKVLKLGFPQNSIALQGIGYRQVLEYLNGKIDLEKCIELVKTAHKQYARRQKTWFEGKGRNYNLQKVTNADEAIQLINNHTR